MKNLQLKHGNKTLCLRFNRTSCTDANCRFTHLCAIRLPNGQARGQKPGFSTQVQARGQRRSPSSAASKHLTNSSGCLQGGTLGSISDLASHSTASKHACHACARHNLYPCSGQASCSGPIWPHSPASARPQAYTEPPFKHQFVQRQQPVA